MGSLISNIVLIVSSFFISFSLIYVWSKFYDCKINYRNKFVYVSLCVMAFVGIFNYLYNNVFFRMVIVLFLFCFSNWLIFRKKINEIIISTIYGQALLTLADVICSLLVIILFGANYKMVREDYIFASLGNILISVCFVVLSCIPFVKRFYIRLISMTRSLSIKRLFFMCLFVIVCINFIMVFSFYEVGSILVIVINSVLLFIYSLIIYKSIVEKNNTVLVQAENDSLMSSLHLYEDMVDRQRVDNHENKNQLLIIRNMIKKKDKDVIKYIETIVKDQKEDDEALYTRVMTIPSGGLQGIIYQKMLVMKDEHIKFSLDVGRGVRDFDLSKLSMDDNYRLCKIIGVLLDNAIEESRNIKDKCIMISLFIDSDDLIIDVSNRFEGKIDIDKLDESGYTTKGDGHGYGLSLVKKILSETKAFENERCINRNVFKQIIRIKNT